MVPFVPLGDTTMDDCIELANGFGARIAERHGIPVFLYANAARRADRARLAAVRRGHEVRDRIRGEPWHDIRIDLRVAASVGVACGQLGERGAAVTGVREAESYTTLAVFDAD